MDRWDFVNKAHLIDEVLNFTTTINFRPFLKVIFPEHSRSFVAIVYKHSPLQAAEPIRKPYEIWTLRLIIKLRHSEVDLINQEIYDAIYDLKPLSRPWP